MSAISVKENKLAKATDDAASFHPSVEAACRKACEHIAPAWPLDRSIAVNPHWGRIGTNVRTVAARLAVLGGVRLFPKREYISNAWAQGRIKSNHLVHALDKCGAKLTEAQCHAALQQEPTIERLPLLIDLLEVSQDGESCFSWRNAVTHQISQTCAAYFDRHQADWRPAPGASLYEFWRTTISHDQGTGVLMGLPDFSECLAHLPATATQAEQWALRKFGLQTTVWADYLEALLLTVNGWASWCAYLGWQARLEGQTSNALRDLLAIRLAWGVILLENCSASHAPAVFKKLQTDWNQVHEAVRDAEKELLVDEVWQLALEIGYQQQLVSQLTSPIRAPLAAPGATSVKAQAVFCIDVRSERLRRAIEQVDPAIRTSGFAGFFGLPIGYSPLGSQAIRPQLPGLLSPSLTVTDEMLAPGDAGAPMALADLENLRSTQFLNSNQWNALSRWPGTSYTFVETVGLAFAGKLGGWLRTLAKDRPRDDLEGIPMRLRPLCRPGLLNTSVDQRAELCNRVLKAMGMTSQFPPLVILVGHGSQSANNPHAASLDCGACGGQTGEVNARVLARILNEPAVRVLLMQQGIEIPDSTGFVAALHNTTTDELEWFDTDLAGPASQAMLAEVQTSWASAQNLVRLERAPSLGMEPRTTGSSELLGVFKQRASDGAQTRPEWALAGNASFLIGPRSVSQQAHLDGRTFLHDYDWHTDSDGSVLELLMTAPMLVTNWINWQYHASLSEPRLYGSGNKVLHNVVGGNIGVFEGNGGDLRQGLSQQSLHDGNGYVHEPLRLTVVISAPQDRILSIVHRHQVLQDLIYNGWIHVWQMNDDQLHALSARGWSPAQEAPE